MFRTPTATSLLNLFMGAAPLSVDTAIDLHKNAFAHHDVIDAPNREAAQYVLSERTRWDRVLNTILQCVPNQHKAIQHLAWLCNLKDDTGVLVWQRDSVRVAMRDLDIPYSLISAAQCMGICADYSLDDIASFFRVLFKPEEAEEENPDDFAFATAHENLLIFLQDQYVAVLQLLLLVHFGGNEQAEGTLRELVLVNMGVQHLLREQARKPMGWWARESSALILSELDEVASPIAPSEELMQPTEQEAAFVDHTPVTTEQNLDASLLASLNSYNHYETDLRTRIAQTSLHFQLDLSIPGDRFRAYALANFGNVGPDVLLEKLADNNLFRINKHFSTEDLRRWVHSNDALPLFAYRLAMGLTQHEFAEKVQVSPTYISMWENPWKKGPYLAERPQGGTPSSGRFRLGNNLARALFMEPRALRSFVAGIHFK